MLDAEWSVEAVAEVALVEVSVHNPTAVDRRVRVENRLDGPTLPPRSEGVPEQGWDADGYAGVVPAGETVRLGFASPATPAEPPVDVADEGRADGPDAAADAVAGTDAPGAGPSATASADGADAAAAVRLLGDGAPPADALPADGERAVDVADDAGPTDPAPTPAATDADVTASVGADAPATGEGAPTGVGVTDPPRLEETRTGGPAPAGDADGETAADADGRSQSTADGLCVPSPVEGGPLGNGTAGSDPDVSGVPGDRGDGPAEPDAPDGADAPDDPGADAPDDPGADRTAADSGTDDADGDDPDAAPARGREPTRAGTESPPAPVEAWLSDVTDRVEHGERLTGASVVEAAAVLDERGGFAAVEGLPDRLAADEAALRALADRATALADRAAATDVPLAALRRLS